GAIARGSSRRGPPMRPTRPPVEGAAPPRAARGGSPTMTMPEALREELVEILASALLADVEKHPHLYGLERPADHGVVAARGETPRDSTRSPQGRRAKRVPVR